MTAAGVVRTLVVPRPGALEIAETPEPALADGCFRAQTVVTGLSAGTEPTRYRGTDPYRHARWDAGLGLFDRARRRHVISAAFEVSS